MASISRSSQGLVRIQFVAEDGTRKSIRLGKNPDNGRKPRYDAEAVCTHIEAILDSRKTGGPLERHTLVWLRNVDATLKKKLAQAGLVATAATPTLGEFVASYIETRSEAKLRTRLNLGMFGNRLIAFFGADKKLIEIKKSDADAWLVYMRTVKKRDGGPKYAPATIGRTVKGARQLFKAACRAELVARNPFEDLKAAATPNKKRRRLVTREETQRVIDACPDAEWRLIVALARYAGLRCPSEHFALKWEDVDFEHERLRIHSPKLEQYGEKAERIIPIFPELRPYLEEAFDLAAPGAVHVIAKHRNASLRTRMYKIVRRAGLVPWPKPFVNLRSSLETELAEVFPMHVVCDWIGNSAAVAQKHYLQTTEDHFERATQSGAKSGAPGAQKAAQQGVAGSGKLSGDSTEVGTNCGFRLDSAAYCTSVQYARRDSNPQHNCGENCGLGAEVAQKAAHNQRRMCERHITVTDLIEAISDCEDLDEPTRNVILRILSTSPDKHATGSH